MCFSYVRDGKVSHDEFSRTLGRLGMKLRPQQLWTLINHYDPEGKGYIDHIQFAEVLSDISGRSVEVKYIFFKFILVYFCLSEVTVLCRKRLEQLAGKWQISC